MRAFWITLTILCALVLIAGEFEAFGQELPDAPSATHHKLVAPVGWQPTHKHLKFITNHPTRTTYLLILGGIGGGLLAAHFTRMGTCPSVINGYPYNGTPPCPSSTYDPTPRRTK